MKLKKWIIVGMLFAGLVSSQAEVILWDLNLVSGTGNDGTVADFIELGVTEDLSGAAVTQVLASASNTMTAGSISLSYDGAVAQDVNSYTEDNGVLADYIYLANGLNGGPVNMQISGLSSVLSANTTYSFYFIGAGDNTNQGAQVTFDGDTLTTDSNPSNPITERVAKFSFTTASTVSDTLDFTWERIGDNDYSGFNGFAIAAVPEPTTIGLIGAFGFVLIISRRVVAFLKKPE